LILIIISISWSSAANNESIKDTAKNQHEVDFQSRIKHYLDVQAKDFIQKMAVKEQFLLQMIQNITKELQKHGNKSKITKEIGFKKIYEEQENLIEQYSQEVNNILKLMDELEDLEEYIIHSENKKLLVEIQDLKSNLQSTLGEQTNAPKNVISRSLPVELTGSASTELDSVLNIYDLLVQFEREARLRNDAEIIKEIEKQKQQIVKIIGNYSPQSDSLNQQKVIGEYIDESEKVVKILREIDKISSKFGVDSIRTAADVERVKARMVSSLDGRIMELAGNRAAKKTSETPITDLFQQWRAQKTADFQSRLTKYRILYRGLIKSSTDSEREKMLENALSDAIMNYSARKFDLAEMQFKEIIKNFGEDFSQIDGVYFYLGEAYYARSYYDAAYKNFEMLTTKYPDSKHLGQALWRLMLISYTYDWKKKFFTHFDKLKDLPASQNAENINNAYYLAGYIYSSMELFKKAKTYLNKIAQETPYYLPGQYLLGIVYINLDNYNRAKKIFEMISKEQNYPWSGVNLASLRNEATMRLGFLHFQRGEYQKAIKVLSQVSQGHQAYDQSLMAQAWAKLKTGRYEESVSKVNNLLSEYLSSNYTYEALVLSAHCKRIMDQPDEAKKDLKYINTAQTVQKLSDEYIEERKRILAQTKELERLETVVLEQRDPEMYEEITKIRDTVNEALLAFNYRGFAGNQLIEEFNDERKKVVRQIEYFDNMLQEAKADARNDLVKAAEKQKERLIGILQTYQPEHSVVNVNHFIEHPLATKEGGIQYRRGVVKNMYQDIVSEKKRLERDVKVLSELIEQHGSRTDISAEVDLEMLQDDLVDLKNKLNRLQIWIANNPMSEVNTDFEKWADFSGFGLSDINYSTLIDKEKKIETYSQNIEAINRLLAKKRKVLETKITNYDRRMSKLSYEVNEEKIRLEKLERKKYFESIYFDTKQKEIERETENEELERILREELWRKNFEDSLKVDDNKDKTKKDGSIQ